MALLCGGGGRFLERGGRNSLYLSSRFHAFPVRGTHLVCLLRGARALGWSCLLWMWAEYDLCMHMCSAVVCCGVHGA